MALLRWSSVALLCVVCCGCCEVFGINCQDSGQISFTVEFHNSCPGNESNPNVDYQFQFPIDDAGDKATISGTLMPGQVTSTTYDYGNDANGDQALDSFEIYMSFLGQTNNYHSVISDGVVVSGSIIKYTLSNGCVVTQEIIPPASSQSVVGRVVSAAIPPTSKAASKTTTSGGCCSQKSDQTARRK